ncbi:MAG: OmpA family protein, partial [Bacteroidaceae bacterium]|nr:OmpA family protein [Bacteroidaceae bacterium]
MKGPKDTNDLSARVGLNFNFNLGESKAWKFGIRPAIVYNLTGNFPQEKLAFDKDRARFEVLMGFTYHFANSEGQRHFAMVPVVDPLAMAAMNEEINVLRETIAAQEAAIAASALEIADLQNSLNDCQNAANQPAEPAVTNILESIVAFQFNQAVIQPSQMPTIERIATYLKDNPGV